MPTYSYACTHCGHTFDIYQAFTDDALTVCPECHGALRKKFSAVGVVFKGSGFYRNDARGSTATTSAGASSSESSTKESSDSGSSAKETSSNGTKDSASTSGASSSGESKGSGSATKTSGSSTAKAATPA